MVMVSKRGGRNEITLMVSGGQGMLGAAKDLSSQNVLAIVYIFFSKCTLELAHQIP